MAACAAALSGLAVFSYLSYVRAGIPLTGALVPMVVAASDIEPGTSLNPGMLEVVKHPSNYLPAQSVATPSALTGKVVNVPVFKGEPITMRKLAHAGGASSMVPAGLRAYSLSISAATSLGFIPKPADRVDVIATLPGEVLGHPSTQTILRYKQVASVGPAQTSGGKLGKLGSSEAPKNLGITLLVSPAEAERLAMAESLGKLTIVGSPASPDAGPGPRPVTAVDIGS